MISSRGVPAPTKTKPRTPAKPYRENVVGFVLNSKQQVLLMKRARTRNHWQLPQGGIEPTETERTAALREVREEVGLTNVKVLAIMRGFHAYDWPKAPVYARDQYRGQRQAIAFLLHRGADTDVQIDRREASGYAWVPINALIARIAPVRKPMAQKALAAYRAFLASKNQQRNVKPFRIDEVRRSAPERRASRIGIR